MNSINLNFNQPLAAHFCKKDVILDEFYLLPLRDFQKWVTVYVVYEQYFKLLGHQFLP